MNGEREASEIREVMSRDHAAGRLRPLAAYLPRGDAAAAELRELHLRLSAGSERFEIRSLLGRGGEGPVYRALDRKLGRLVALKRVEEDFEDRKVDGRRPWEALAPLHHPGLVEVLDIRREGSRIDLVMGLVNGPSLDAWWSQLEEQRDTDGRSWRRLATVLRRACDALTHAEERDVLHGDLKASNLLVGRDDRPVVIDFPLTHARTTPASLAPERHDGSPPTAASELFAFGALIHETVCGHAPFEGPTRAALWKAIQQEAPRCARVPRAQLARDLLRIASCALEKRPGRRYSGFRALGDDLERALLGQPLRARSPSRLEALARWSRTHRLLAASLCVFFCSLFGMTAWSGRRALQEADARERVEAGITRLDGARRRTREALERFRDLEAGQRCRQLIAAEPGLWPPVPERIDGPEGMEAWLRAADALLFRRATIESHRRSALATTEGIEGRFLISNLDAVLDGFNELERLRARVAKRRRFAAEVEDLTLRAPADRWREAIEEIANPQVCPAYGGLRIEPQLGLIPLGRSPRSRLWEFFLPFSGGPPRDAVLEGDESLRPEDGIVFVLLPAMHLPSGSPSPGARIEAFFLSKFETTQAQWLRLCGVNPSLFRPDAPMPRSRFTLAHPVENLTHAEARLIAERLGLEVPSELQWEAAARGGRAAPWWSGPRPEALYGRENLTPESLNDPEDERDGYRYHAPVGSLEANPYGLCDLLGNVSEWCVPDPRQRPLGPPGSRLDSCRGGAYHSTPERARCDMRNAHPAGTRRGDCGVRFARKLSRH